MQKHLGEQSVRFEKPPTILSAASIVGPKEGKGPLASYFDLILDDILWGEDTWEKAETKLLKEAIQQAVSNAKINMEQIQYILAGDLLDQLIATTFAMRELKRPFLGLYGACSTMAESMALGAMMIDGGYADYIVGATSSHHSSAEKQFRSPLQLGTQRPLTASWTVTGSGAVVLSKKGTGPYITYATIGKVVDFGIKDPMNMGASMVPAAVDTMIQHFIDTNRKPEDYDLIVTGDLGSVGKQLVIEMANEQGYDLSKNYTDCGVEIFDADTQDTHAGGSGCACAGVTFTGYILKEMQKETFKKVLFIPTGALLSPLSTQQGESIPGIAHAVVIESSLE